MFGDLLNAVRELPQPWASVFLVVLVGAAVFAFAAFSIRKGLSDGFAAWDLFWARVIGGVAWASSRIRVERMRRRLQGRFNRWAGRINDRFFAHDPTEVTRVSVTIYDREIDEAIGKLEDGEALLFLDPDEPEDVNLCRMMTWLVGAMGVSAVYRNYVDAHVADAFELTLAQIFLREEAPALLATFQRQIYEPAVGTDPASQTMRYCARMQTIDDGGLFDTAVLSGFRGFGAAVLGTHPRVRHKKESAAFIRWVHDIATRPPGDESVPLSFPGREIRCAFAPIGSRVAQHPIGTYRRYIDDDLDDGIDYIFVLARDHNIKAAGRVVAPYTADDRVLRVHRRQFLQRIDTQSALSEALDGYDVEFSRPTSGAFGLDDSDGGADEDEPIVATSVMARQAVCYTIERSPTAPVLDTHKRRERPDDDLTISDFSDAGGFRSRWLRRRR